MCTPWHLTAMCSKRGRKFRKWGAKNFWDDLCFVCVTMAKIRHGNLSLVAICELLDIPCEQVHFQQRSAALQTLQAENRKCITASQIESRRLTLLQFEGAMAVNAGVMWSWMFLTDFMNANPQVNWHRMEGPCKHNTLVCCRFLNALDGLANIW